MRIYDLIIVGAGPAGITASVYAARKKVTVQRLEEPRRRAGLNLPYGFAGALPRAELLRKKLNFLQWFSV